METLLWDYENSSLSLSFCVCAAIAAKCPYYSILNAHTCTPTNSEKVKDTNIGFVKIPSKLKKKLSIRFFSNRFYPMSI